MGMYDEVICSYPLPIKEAQNMIFQTKNLDRTLSTYRITTDGRLIDNEDIDIEYNGEFNFYDIGYNFIAKFVDGQLQSIKRVRYGR